MANIEDYSYPTGLHLLARWQSGDAEAKREMIEIFDAALAGDFDTNFIDDEFLTKPDALKKLNEADDDEHEAAVVASFLVDSQKKRPTKIPCSNSHQESRWKIAGRRKQLES